MQNETKPIDAINAFIEEMGRKYVENNYYDTINRVALYFIISPTQAQKVINKFLKS